jgi:hypothetical protein
MSNKDITRQLDQIFNDVEKAFEKVDKDLSAAFGQMEKIMDQVQQESWESVNKRQKWEPYVSWIPRKIGKRWYWHSHIYRKYQFDKGNGYYVYGTEFDVLKSSK